MQVEEISFVNDIIQDTRADARECTKYDLLIRQIFKNCKLNWNNDGLILKSDEKLFNLLEVIEPSIYEKKLSYLLEEKEKEE